MTAHRSFPRWPLALIALPAASIIWSGWVGLGQLCGFGPVNVLPGIGGGFTINTAIFLPVGVETYAAYALGAWLGPWQLRDDVRKFARRSAIGALALGMSAQVVFHLLTAARATVAPWPVTVLVSCMPVAVLGLSAALAHLLRDPGTAPSPTAPGAVPAVPAPVSAPAAAKYKAPALRPIMSQVGVGADKARRVQRLLASEVRAAASTNGHGPHE